VFYNYYTKVKLAKTQFYLIFSIILKGQANLFYYNKIFKRLYDFITIIKITKTYFKTKKRQQKYLIK
jgi:hypothetical protein